MKRSWIELERSGNGRVMYSKRERNATENSNPLTDWHAVSALQRRKFIAIKPIVDLYTSYYKCIIQMKLLKNMHIV